MATRRNSLTINTDSDSLNMGSLVCCSLLVAFSFELYMTSSLLSGLLLYVSSMCMIGLFLERPYCEEVCNRGRDCNPEQQQD